jgi:hypothetical protein
MFRQPQLQGATQAARRIFDEMRKTVIGHRFAPMMLNDLREIAAFRHDTPT